MPRSPFIPQIPVVEIVETIPDAPEVLVPVEDSENPTGHDDTDEKIHSEKKRSPVSMYMSWATRFGWPVAVSMLLMARLSSIGGTYVLKLMAAQASPRMLASELGLFGLLSLSQAFCFFLFIYLLYRLCIVPAAFVLHARLMDATLTRDLAFFQTTSAAETLNLFTNDVARVDMSLNGSIISLVAQYVNLALACTVLVAAMPLSAFILLPLAAAGHYLQQTYLVKLRQLRHLDVETRAPLLSHLQEAVTGRILFALHGLTQARAESFAHLVEQHVRCAWPLSCIDLWLGVRFELLSIVLQVAALWALLAASAEPGVLGFVMTYVFQVTSVLSSIAKISAQFEADAVSIARITNVSENPVVGATAPSPAPLTLLEPVPYSDSGPDQAWPQYGQVEFRGVSARHRPGLPDTLQSVSFTVKPGEKVAIIGRTGAGKSSMLLALLKLMDQTGGQIIVDGVDIANVGDARLRTSLAVVPQTQLVLSGTVRQNLDPWGRHLDEDILAALTVCGGVAILRGMVGEETSVDDAALLDVHLGPR